MDGKLNLNIRSIDALRVSLRDSHTSRIDIKTPTSIMTYDYNHLQNLPSINGVLVKGDMTASDLFLTKESINTKAYWNLNPLYIPEVGELIVYQDRSTINGVDYPGIKIGDGKAYLVDLPFVNDDYYNSLLNAINTHISDLTVHVTSEEKTFWNNKLNCTLDDENLILNRN